MYSSVKDRKGKIGLATCSSLRLNYLGLSSIPLYKVV